MNELFLRSNLNQAIYDLGSYYENKQDANYKRLRAYIRRKIRELEEIKAQNYLKEEQKNFLKEAGVSK